MNRAIYTIGRQYGSGGRQVGKFIAEKLGIPFYDKKILEEAARQSGIDISHFEEDDEKKTHRQSLLQSIYFGIYGNQNVPAVHQVILAEFKAIRELAQRGPCVFIGHCANYVLRNRQNVISVFVTASIDARSKRAIEEYGDAKENIVNLLRKIDRERADYYHYYADRTWSAADTYDLTVSTDRMSLEEAAEMIIEAAKTMRYKEG